MRAARPPLSDLLVLAALAAGLVLPPLLRGSVLGHYGITHEYSLLAFVAREVRAAQMPFWNSYTAGGNPGLADPASSVFYPLTIPLLKLVPVAAAANAMIVLHMILAAVFMHLYLGGLGLRRPARFTGAAVYMLSGFEIWRIVAGDIPRLITYAWIPLLFHIVDQIAAGRARMGAALLGAACMACQFFAGDPQTFVYASLLLAVYGAGRVAAQRAQRDAAAHGRRSLSALCTLFVLAAGFAAVQILPTLENFRFSNRAAFDAGFAFLGSIPPLGLVSLLAPRFFGDEIHSGWGEGELGAPEFYPHAASLYAGFFTLALIVVAVLARRDRWHVRFFAVSGAVVLWIALGRFGYLYRVVTYVPLLRGFRDIENINILLPLIASALAAHGFDRYLEPDETPALWRRARAVMAWTVAAAAGLVAATILAQRQAGLDLLAVAAARRAMIGSAVFVLIAWGISSAILRARAVSRAVPAGLVAVPIGFLLADLMFWAAPLVNAATDIRPMAENDAVTRYLDRDRTIYRVSGLYDRGPIFGVQDTGGEPSLLLARYEDYTDVLQGNALAGYARPVGPHGVSIQRGCGSALSNLLNVKYCIVSGNVAAQGQLTAGPLAEVAPGTFVVRSPGVVPRAFAARGYRLLQTPSAILAALSRPDFDPYAFVLLEERPALPPAFDPAPPAARPGDVRIVSYADNHVVVRAAFDHPGFLVLADLYYPAWRAAIDGRPVHIYRADYLFRAVVVPAGTHEVRFVYQDRAFALGLLIALGALACGLIAWFVDCGGLRGRAA